MWDGILISIFGGFSSAFYFFLGTVWSGDLEKILLSEMYPLLRDVSYSLLLTIILYLIVRLHYNIVQNSRFLLSAVVIFSLTVGIIDMSFFLLMDYDMNVAARTLFFVMGLLIALMEVFLVHLIQKQEKNVSKLREREVLRSYEEKRVHELNDLFLSIQKMRHDINDQINVVRQLYNSNRTDEGERMLFEIETSLPNVISTGVASVDAELSIKEAQMKAADVKYQLTVCHLGDVSIMSLDICSIIHNMLENAIEELRRGSDSYSYICFNTETSTFT